MTFYAWLSKYDQNIASPLQRARKIRGSIFMFGKLVLSIAEGHFGASCFNEHMIEDNCENKGQL